jgi:hypothetical protein
VNPWLKVEASTSQEPIEQEEKREAELAVAPALVGDRYAHGGQQRIGVAPQRASA